MEILDVVGHSGGLITTLSPTLKNIESRKMASMIEVKIQDQEIGIIPILLNIYGPLMSERPTKKNSD